MNAKSNGTVASHGNDQAVEVPAILEQAQEFLRQGKKTKVQKAAKQEEKEVSIPSLKVAVCELLVEGDSGLISHKFSGKSERQMQEKQAGKPKDKKAPRDPEQEFKDSLHVIRPGVYGFPACGFKAAAVAACRYVEDLSMAFTKGAFYVMGDLVEITGKAPVPRQDYVRIGQMGSSTDLRYRGEFPAGWQAKLTIRYNAAVIQPAQLAHLFNVAGFAVGVGDWRPGSPKSSGGNHGMFHVVGAE